MRGVLRPRFATLALVALGIALAGCVSTRIAEVGTLPNGERLITLVVTENRQVVYRQCQDVPALGAVLGCQTSRALALPNGVAVRAVKIVRGLHEAVDEMASTETFRGYGPEPGYDFLTELIATSDYRERGIAMSPDEIFVSDGGKSDSANIQEIFAPDCVVAVMDPVYPVYVDSNVMAGRAGALDEAGRYSDFLYLPCTADNGFEPALPSRHVDLIYLCYPNNPTGAVMTRETLARWIDYARPERAVILYDAAYEAYVREAGVPRSIYEVAGAREVAIEFRSFSKAAGFTGTRCAFTVV